MRIAYLTLYHLPDLVPEGPITKGLMEGLVERGHEVTITTSVPHYAWGRIQPGHRGHLVNRSVEGGVRVFRTWVWAAPRSDLKGRLLSFLSFMFLGGLVGLVTGPYNVVLFYGPPPTNGVAALLTALLGRSRLFYHVADIWPEQGIQTGIFKAEKLIRLLQKIESFYYRRSRGIVCLSEEAKQILLEKDVPEQKIHVIPDFVDTDFIVPLPNDTWFRSQNGLNGKFIVFYGGNIGLYYGLDTVLDSAHLHQDQEDIAYLLVGAGAAKDALEERAQQLGLKNVLFLPYEPQEELPHVLATADVSLVTLQQSIGSISTPSKMRSIMASGRPMIVCVDEGSATHRLVETAQCGLWVPAGNAEALSKAIMRFKLDPALREELGRNGREYAVKHFSRQQYVERYADLIESCVS